jgi:hypothetical protein
MESVYAMMKVDRKRVHNLVRYQSLMDLQETLIEQRETNRDSDITLHLYIYESIDDSHECNKWHVKCIKIRRKLVYKSINNQLLRYGYYDYNPK